MRRNFTYRVTIDGTDIAGMTLAGGSIQYGATSSGENAQPSTAFVELISADAAGDLVSEYPGISWRGGIPSGYVDTFDDTYEGAVSALKVGNSLCVRVATPSGYVDTFEANYRTGFDVTRFTGHIAAIDYTPGLIAITAVDSAERLARTRITPLLWPAETESARVARIATAAGIAVDVVGTASVEVIATTDNESETDAWRLLTTLADATGAVAYVDREGTIIYRARDAAPGTTYIIPPGVTLLNPLQMTSELGDVVNSIVVEYGDRDPNTGDRPTVSATDQPSIDTYGVREPTGGPLRVPLQHASDAQALADRWIGAYAEPRWHLPSVRAHLGLADADGTTAGLLTADLDDVLELPQLLPASPEASYASRVLGYTERLDPSEWVVTYVLDPNGWSREGIAV
jgi:hypothetical protein